MPEIADSPLQLPSTEQERAGEEKRERAERLEGELTRLCERPRAGRRRDAAMVAPSAALLVP